MDYSKHVSTRKTPQNQPVIGTDQVENSAGGYTWKIDKWGQLDRFLIIGTEGGTYYIREQDLTMQNAKAVMECIDEDGLRVVRRTVEISDAGRAPKNDSAIFVLAMCAAAKDDDVRSAALDALPQVARIGTHLFIFCNFVEAFRGWGRGLRRSVANWYTDKDADHLAYQLIKYQQRDGWSHADVLRLAHPDTDSDAHRAMFAWATGYGDRKDYQETDDAKGALPDLIIAKDAAAQAEDTANILAIIDDHPGFPWQAIPSEFLGDPEIWQALVPRLPMTTTIRNLARMTASGAMKPMNDTTKQVIEKITDGENLRKARVHPISVLTAMMTYSSGHSKNGSLTWSPIGPVVDALDDAYYAAFDNVEPTGQRWVLGVDISSSMTWEDVAGINGLTPRMAAAAMAMVTARTEDQYAMMAFSNEFTPLSITPRMRMDTVVEAMSNLPHGGTDCALPMLWASENEVEADVFVVYTDNETWYGNIHPHQALQEYREKMGIPAKLIVVGMVANDFSIADPNDPGMLDVVGFDTAAPNLIAEFAKTDIGG